MRDPALEGDRMPEHDELRRRPSFVRVGLAGAAGATALAVGLVISSKPAPPQAVAEPATPSTSATGTPSSTPTSTATSTATPAAGAQYPRDAQGFTGTSARCDQGQVLAAFGRTTRALVVICADADGQLEYRGVRLSDDAWLSIPAGKTSDGSIVATNDGVTYSVSPTMFLVSEGDTVLYRDSWAEFGQPRPAETTPTQTAPEGDDSAAATTTVRTTTVTVTTTVGPTSAAGG